MSRMIPESAVVAMATLEACTRRHEKAVKRFRAQLPPELGQLFDSLEDLAYDESRARHLLASKLQHAGLKRHHIDRLAYDS